MSILVRVATQQRADDDRPTEGNALLEKYVGQS